VLHASIIELIPNHVSHRLSNFVRETLELAAVSRFTITGTAWGYVDDFMLCKIYTTSMDRPMC
jgi:hypothetical protein